MFAVVFINCFFLVMDILNLTNLGDLVDYICLSFYTAEASLKLIGYGINKYFSDSWNLFDFSILILSYFSYFFLTIFSAL